ncbi:MAG: DUF4349 domain-containing protein [Treponema sp.]|nr:DUF4349 domain-containing protein [Treponema sp.]
MIERRESILQEISGLSLFRLILLPQLVFFAVVLFSCASSPPSDSGTHPQGYISRYEGASETPAEERMITYSVSLGLSVKDIEGTRKTIAEQTKIYKGFIVGESTNYITARIPAANMDAFIGEIKALGKTEEERKNGTDITDQYRDNVIRLESLKTVRDRYLGLLAKANTVTDILSIEKELERVNVEIEILEGKIKYAELSVAYSSVTVGFREKAKPGPLGWIFYGIYQGIKWLVIW